MKKIYLIIATIAMIKLLTSCSDIINSDTNINAIPIVDNSQSDTSFTKDMLIISPLIIGPVKADSAIDTELTIFNNSDSLSFLFNSFSLNILDSTNNEEEAWYSTNKFPSIIKPKSYYSYKSVSNTDTIGHVQLSIVFNKAGEYKNTIIINNSKKLHYDLIIIVEK